MTKSPEVLIRTPSDLWLPTVIGAFTVCVLIGLFGDRTLAVSLNPTTDELYGRRGDPGVLTINGRIITVKISMALSAGSWVRYLTFWDITISGTVWGDIRPLNAGAGQVTIRDISGNGGPYSYTVDPQGNDLILKIGVPGSSDSQSVSLREVALFYLKEAVTQNWTVQLGSTTYYIVPQVCSSSTILRGPGECQKSLLFYGPGARKYLDDSSSDFQSLAPEYLVDLASDVVPIGSSGFGLRRTDKGGYQLLRMP